MTIIQSVLWHYSMSGQMQIGWRPGIGDPTFMGWLTVAVYLLTAIACWLRAQTAVSNSDFQFHGRFWRGLAAILLLLGINKQLNFLSLFTSLGRTWAWHQEWWQERQLVQFWLIGTFIALILILVIISSWRLRHLSGRYLRASVGILLLGGFVLIRATSLHAVDHYLYTPFAGIRLNWVIELGLLVLLLLIAVFPTNLHPKYDSVSMPLS